MGAPGRDTLQPEPATGRERPLLPEHLCGPVQLERQAFRDGARLPRRHRRHDIVAIPTGAPPAAAHEHACVAPPLALRQRRYQYEYRYKRETVASGGVRTRVSAVSVSQAGAASVTGDGVRVRAHSKPG